MNSPVRAIATVREGRREVLIEGAMKKGGGACPDIVVTEAFPVTFTLADIGNYTIRCGSGPKHDPGSRYSRFTATFNAEVVGQNNPDHDWWETWPAQLLQLKAPATCTIGVPAEVGVTVQLDTSCSHFDGVQAVYDEVYHLYEVRAFQTERRSLDASSCPPGISTISATLSVAPRVPYQFLRGSGSSVLLPPSPGIPPMSP